jgi:hypothetical protein
MAKLHLKIIPGRDLTPELLRQMSALRRSIMTIKPDVDLDADFDWFASICRASHRAVLFFDEHQALAGMYVFLLRRGRTAQGRRYLLVVFEFGFLLPQYRANAVLLRSGLRVICLMLAQWRGESLWAGGVGYPAGMLVVGKVFDDLVLRGETGLSAHQTALLEDITQEICAAKWNPDSGRVTMATVPPHMSAGWLAHAATQPLYARYMRLCPDWAQGFGLPWVARVCPWAVLWRSLKSRVKRRA